MDRRLFVCIIALCIAANTNATEEDSKETENIECKQDGFLPHPTNCRAYYWCSLRRRVRAIILECEENEIFDTQSQKCTQPNLSTRIECGGTKRITEDLNMNPRNVRSPAQLRNTPNGCSKEEFVGDENDCSKFYRCVNNGGGQFTRYEFSCSPGTVWDSDISSCNHPWAVKSKCGHGLISSSPSQNYPPQGEYSPIAEQPYPIKNPDPYPIYPQQPPQGTPGNQGYEPIPYPPQSQGGYNPNWPQPQNPYPAPAPAPEPEQPPKETTPVEQPQEGYDNPNPTYERPQGGYRPPNEYNPQQQFPEIPSPSPPTTQKPQLTSSSDKNEESSSSPPIIDNEINSNSGECQVEGFLPDSNDCRKFYRCVTNGKRRFMKYEFTCGQGTVWDSEINACNHVWAVRRNNCKNKIDPASNETSEESNIPGSETNGQTNGTTEEKPNNKEPIGEGGSKPEEITSTSTTEGYSPISSTTVPNISTTNEQTNSSPSEETPSTNKEISYSCTKEGFIPDKNDCKKFYRCVQNNKKGFIKYEFSCGQGTVWDPDANTCNFPWATRNKCGKGTESGTGDYSNDNSTRPIDNEINTEKGPIPIDTSGNNYSTEKPNVPTKSPENSQTNGTTTTENTYGGSSTEKETPQLKNECTNEEDYLADKQDCKKFYRCVKSNKKGFIKYEFSCGQGTVWDPDAKTCNYPWATRSKCGTGQESGPVDSTPTSSTESSSYYENVSSTTPSYSSPETPVPGIDSQTDKSPSPIYESTTSVISTSPSHITEGKPTLPEQTPNTTSINADKYDNCKSDGFIGDSKNCKKFYRCVDNGKGGFTKYEFTCGEGTVWDSIVDTCNYPWAVKGNCSIKGVESEEASISEAPTTAQTSTSIEEKENISTTEKSEITTVGQTPSTDSGNKETQSTQPSSTGEASTVTPTTQVTTEASTSEPSTEKSTEITPTTQVTTEASSSEASTEKSTEITPTTQATTEASSSEPSTEKSSTIIPTTQITTEASSSEPSSEQSPVTDSTTEASSTSQQPSTAETTEQASTVSVSSETSPTNQEGPTSEKINKCTNEGFFPNLADCTKFYRCVANEKGGYTKYDFDCGGGTIWDPDINTCNHPYAVTNKKCEQGSQQQPPKDQCTTGGYFPNSQDCKSFYRCVDNGKGQYIKHDFKCGDNTIWDPKTLSCNHPWATENKACGHRGDNIPPTPTPEKETKTEPPKETSSVTQPTTEQEIVTTVPTQQTTISSTTEIGSTEGQTTENPKEITETSSQPSEQTTTTEKLTTPIVDSSSEPSTISVEGSTTEKELTTTTETSTNAPTESIGTTVSTESTPSTDSSSEPTVSTESSSPTDSSSEQTVSTESLSTDSSSEPTTISTDSSSEQTTTSIDSSSEQTTTSIDSSSEPTTTSIDSSSEPTTASIDSSSEPTSTSTDSSSEPTSISTDLTTTDSSSTESSTSTDVPSPVTVTATPPPETNQTASCPISQLEGDQMALVCPTGFKRHPKYCNLFYQCTSNPDTFEINVLVISCPGRRIYDDSRIQCLPPDETDQECTGQIAEKEQLRKFGKSISPMEMENEEPLCPNEGNFPLDPTECNNNFIKCQKSSGRSMNGFMYQCPEGFSYWPVSKKCEMLSPALPCEPNLQQEKIWQIPVEVIEDPSK